MLDWPEQIQTSPTTMLARVMVLLPLMTRSAGFAFAESAARSTRHLPSASAVVESVWSAKVTETFSPAEALPQTGMGFSRWRTALSVNNGAGTTSARGAHRGTRVPGRSGYYAWEEKSWARGWRVQTRFS